jgi:outer membrane protein assembly factor BamB
MVSATLTTSLRDTLRAGCSVVSELWSRNAKDWMMCVHAADINNDGELEVLTSSRDGRINVFNKNGDVRWKRIVGDKAWVGTISGVPFQSRIQSNDNAQASYRSLHPVRVLAGTRTGKVYAFDQYGQTISKDGKIYPLPQEDHLPEKEDQQACWLDTGTVISQIVADLLTAPDAIISSHDGWVYAINYETGDIHWRFQADGWVRALCVADLDNDGRAEIILGTNEASLYILTADGKLRAQTNRHYPIQSMHVADIDKDGSPEILVATHGKDLTALTASFEHKWSRPFKSRLLCLWAADVDIDGHCEIFAGSEDGHLYILNKAGKKLWQHNLEARFFSIFAANVDNDEDLEVLVGAEDGKIHVYKIRLSKDLEQRIRKCYLSLGSATADVESSLAADERALLHDLLRAHHRSALRQINIEDVKEKIAQKNYLQALSDLLTMQEYKVQVLWSKGRKQGIGFPRSLCFGKMNGETMQVIVGTNDGKVFIYNQTGRLIRSIDIGQHARVLDVQTGVFDSDRTEKIIVYTSDHQAYILAGNTRQEKHRWPLGYDAACVHVAEGRPRQTEVLVGSENVMHIYRDDLRTPAHTITLQEPIRLIHAHIRSEEDTPEIIAGGASRTIYAFKHGGTTPLWSYPTWDRIQAIDLRDIDGDGETEILVGAEDRNVYVIDSHGWLRWRYLLPHSVLALKTCDIDHDTKIEILAGCADGNLYVLDKDGNLLWKYSASDRIRTLKAADIDGDGCIEIVLGIEDELEVLRVLDQGQVRKLIDHCLLLWQKETSSDTIDFQLLHTADPLLHAFAIARLARQHPLPSDGLSRLEQHKEGSIEVRKALLQATILHYTDNPQWACTLLEQFLRDRRQMVRLAMIEHLPLLAERDWKQSIHYLARFLQNDDRMLRRAVVRQLDQLLSLPRDRQGDKDISELLFKAAQASGSVWIQQEAARVLAHLLDHRNSRLIFYMHLLITREMSQETLEMIANLVTIPLTRKFIRGVLPLLCEVQEADVLNRLSEVVSVLKEMTEIEFGRDALKRYTEFQHLFMLNTIEDIAHYRYLLRADEFEKANDLAAIACDIFAKMRSIHRYLMIYLRRISVDDRLASLLDARKAIDEAIKFEEHEYSGHLAGQSMQRLPDHQLFQLLLQRWSTLVTTQFTELRGKAALHVELQTRSVRNEERVSIRVLLKNTGRGSADTIQLTLLHNENDEFEAIGSRSLNIETMQPQEERAHDFTLAPCAASLDLVFEVTYNDAETEMKKHLFSERLELVNVSLPHGVRYIRNPYSTGTPMQEMFFGRDEAVDALRNNLVHSAAQTVLLLYGQRRTGKTTLLLHLANTAVLDEHIPVFVDMQRESYEISAGKFLYHLAFYICQALEKRHYALTQPPQEDFTSDPTFTFDLFLNEVEATHTGQKLIILIDEFEVLEEQITKGRIKAELLEYLRSTMQYHHSINFLLAGTHKIDQLTEKNWSVFFNLARHYRLSRLSASGANDLITRPLEHQLEYAPYTVEKIRQLTADQPYLIHLMCRSLVDHCNTQRKNYVTLNDVSTVLPEVMLTCGSHFDWLWKQLNEQEQTLLAMISYLDNEDGKSLTLVDLESGYRYHRLSYEREQLQLCLKSLAEADILESASEDQLASTLFSTRVRVPVGLMRRWLRKEKPAHLLLDFQTGRF